MPTQTFILIGRSGCGKGTQGKLIEEYLKTQDKVGGAKKAGRPVYYLETGARFREFFKEESYSSSLAREIYDRDDRQPDFLAIWMWSHLLLKDLTEGEHLIADGTCRSLPEAQVFDGALKFYKRKANIVYIDVGREWSEKRLLARGRADDASLAKITKRLDWFDRDVMPAIEYYKNNSDYNFVAVNGEQPIETVHADIVEKIKVLG